MLSLQLTLRMSMDCTYCHRSLNKPEDAADNESIREHAIAIRTNSPEMWDEGIFCPKCGKITHNKAVIAKFKRQQESVNRLKQHPQENQTHANQSRSDHANQPRSNQPVSHATIQTQGTTHQVL